MLDGPIADLRRFNERVGTYGFITPPEPICAIEKMLATSRGIFIQPLVELEEFARGYTLRSTDETLM